jgi:uncharacterized protein related to proFAR isomerase
VQVIPVIDIRHGVVVHAIGGDRANYRPIVSPLFEGHDPRDATSGLMALHPFPVIYIADLDGIEGRGANGAAIEALARSRPGVGFWVDCGAHTVEDVALVCALGDNATVVIGSETGIGPAQLGRLTGAFPGRIVLSLDFRGDHFQGEPTVLAEPAVWPQRVIAMTLGSVGRAAGPDVVRIADLKRRSPGSRVSAAGGIRNRGDLDAARRAGACGALISTALHAHTITAGDLTEVTGR